MLPRPTSKETPRLTLPDRAPVDTTSRRLVVTPLDIRHVRLVSEPHLDCSQLECPIRTAPELSAARKLPPCNVTKVEPVARPFVRLTTLKADLSALIARDMLPTRDTTVAATIRELRPSWLIWHTRLVSDCHALPSHAVAPTRTDPEYPTTPTLEPCSVTLIDPVVAPFAFDTRLTRSRSPDTPREKLPLSIPLVTKSRCDRADTRLTLHCTLLSDIQSVPTLAVCPTRSHPDVAASPAFDPCNVILAEPVTA